MILKLILIPTVFTLLLYLNLISIFHSYTFLFDLDFFVSLILMEESLSGNVIFLSMIKLFMNTIMIVLTFISVMFIIIVLLMFHMHLFHFLVMVSFIPSFESHLILLLIIIHNIMCI
jgi:hypothetical protein